MDHAALSQMLLKTLVEEEEKRAKLLQDEAEAQRARESVSAPIAPVKLAIPSVPIASLTTRVESSVKRPRLGFGGYASPRPSGGQGLKIPGIGVESQKEIAEERRDSATEEGEGGRDLGKRLKETAMSPLHREPRLRADRMIIDLMKSAHSGGSDSASSTGTSPTWGTVGSDLRRTESVTPEVAVERAEGPLDLNAEGSKGAEEEVPAAGVAEAEGSAAEGAEGRVQESVPEGGEEVRDVSMAEEPVTAETRGAEEELAQSEMNAEEQETEDFVDSVLSGERGAEEEEGDSAQEGDTFVPLEEGPYYSDVVKGVMVVDPYKVGKETATEFAEGLVHSDLQVGFSEGAGTSRAADRDVQEEAVAEKGQEQVNHTEPDPLHLSQVGVHPEEHAGEEGRQVDSLVIFTDTLTSAGPMVPSASETAGVEDGIKALKKQLDELTAVVNDVRSTADCAAKFGPTIIGNGRSQEEMKKVQDKLVEDMKKWNEGAAAFTQDLQIHHEDVLRLIKLYEEVKAQNLKLSTEHATYKEVQDKVLSGILSRVEGLERENRAERVKAGTIDTAELSKVKMEGFDLCLKSLMDRGQLSRTLLDDQSFMDLVRDRNGFILAFEQSESQRRGQGLLRSPSDSRGRDYAREDRYPQDRRDTPGRHK